jgi:hypothetical protein
MGRRGYVMSYEAVLERMGKKKTVMNTNKRRKLEYLELSMTMNMYEEWHEMQTLEVHPSGKTAWSERNEKKKDILAHEPERMVSKNNQRVKKGECH